MRRALLLLLALALAGALATASTADVSKKPQGVFKLRYAAARTADDKTIQQILKSTGVLEDTVGTLNELLILPRNVTVLVRPGQDGPYYDPSRKLIVLNDDFVATVADTFNNDDPSISAEDLAAEVVGVETFVLLHEMGHALIDVYDLPVLGKEEDAVDGLATVLMVELSDVGAEIALATAQFFGILGAAKTSYEFADFWDEHSLDLQRAFSIICWVYGSAPKKQKDLRSLIPGDRIGSCPAEYRQKKRSWLKLLAPSVRP